MAQLVASLHTPDGKVSIAGFYDDVLELSPAERAEMAGLPFNDTDYLCETGAPATFGEPGYSTLERLWTRPTVEVNGMWGGYQGEGSKTVIPHEANAKLTCRLVPDQQPDDICAKLVRHLEQHTPAGVRVSILPGDHDARPYAVPNDHVGLQVAGQVLHELYGEKPVFVRMGGTLPVSELFLRELGIHTVFFSFSTADEDFHAPNEFFRVSRYYDGLKAWARYWEVLGVRARR
jgi:acetylornithine deacetylase/succinyl-diaminopimelate desuccinylase-like protein